MPVPKISSGPSVESINAETNPDPHNPTKISDETLKLFSSNNIEIGKLIRKGRYGALYDGQFGPQFEAKSFALNFKCDYFQGKCVPEKKQKFALKFIDIPVRQELGVQNVGEAVDKEVKALLNIQNSGVVELFCAISLSKKSQWFLFMELSDGNFQSFLKNKRKSKQKMSNELSKSVIRQLIEAVKYLHENGITHGNIKASNVLYFKRDKNEDKIIVKLADFVSSQKIDVKQINSLKLEEKQYLEDRMEEDVFDLYFLITETMASTQFESEDCEHSAHESTLQLITTEGKSIQLLNTLLTSKFLSN